MSRVTVSPEDLTGRLIVQNQAWVTMATNDAYALGALVLGYSLKRSGTMRKKVIMVTRTVSDNMQSQLRRIFDEVVDVAELDSGDEDNLALMNRPELGITYTKLHCWKLTQFVKCVFLDADTLVLRNCDELFDRDELSAAPDPGWPDCFNSGVFVFVPSEYTYKGLLFHAHNHGSFDGGDQGLLNTYFSDWATKDIAKHLPFIYNMCACATYTYLPAYRYYGHTVRIIHYIGSTKPWHVLFDHRGQPVVGKENENSVDLFKQWWQIYHSDVRPKLPPELLKILPNQPAHVHTFGPQERHAPEPARADVRESWEEGRPDYRGSASFDNILKKIESSMSRPEQSPCQSAHDLRTTSLPNLNEPQHFQPPEQHHVHFNHQDQHTHFHPDHHHHHHHDPGFLERSQSNPDLLKNYVPFEAPDPRELNKARWEQGYPDYMGENAFDRIKDRLDAIVRQDEQGFPVHREYDQPHDYDHCDTGYHSAGAGQTLESSPEQQKTWLAHSDSFAEPREWQEPGEFPDRPIPEDFKDQWEGGQPDYLGSASFDNILRRIKANLGDELRPPAPSKIKVGLPVKKTKKEREAEELEKRKKKEEERRKKKKMEEEERRKRKEEEEKEQRSKDGAIVEEVVPKLPDSTLAQIVDFVAKRTKLIVVECNKCGFDQEVPKNKVLSYFTDVF